MHFSETIVLVYCMHMVMKYGKNERIDDRIYTTNTFQKNSLKSLIRFLGYSDCMLYKFDHNSGLYGNSWKRSYIGRINVALQLIVSVVPCNPRGHRKHVINTCSPSLSLYTRPSQSVEIMSTIVLNYVDRCAYM